MMNFLKEWIIQYQNKYSVGGVETTIERITGTVSQEGDTISAAYLNEIQRNCIYQVNATRVIEGVLEIYDITIDGSEEFTPFNQTFLIDFSETNTKTDSLLRFNGITYSLRFSDSISNGDISPKIGDIQKRGLVKLDVTNSKAIIFDVKPSVLHSPAFTGTPTAPTPSASDDSTKIATTAFVNAMLNGNTIPTKSLASNGYVKMANGLILQWKSGTEMSAQGSQDITLPIAFPNTCLKVLVSSHDTTPITTNDGYFDITAYTKTTISIFYQQPGTSLPGTKIPLIFAIGY